jgi:hypothetical protein
MRASQDTPIAPDAAISSYIHPILVILSFKAMINRLRAIFIHPGFSVHPVHSVFFLAAALPAILLLSAPAQAQFAGGSGTAEDPYQVQTLQQLQLIADSVYLNRHFIQVADIDASETEHWNDGRGFRPIGWPEAPDGGRPFSGSYYGNGHSIGYLHIDRKEHDEIGLFGRVTGKLENMVLDSVRVSGKKMWGDWPAGCRARRNTLPCRAWSPGPNRWAVWSDGCREGIVKYTRPTPMSWSGDWKIRPQDT